MHKRCSYCNIEFNKDNSKETGYNVIDGAGAICDKCYINVYGLQYPYTRIVRREDPVKV